MKYNIYCDESCHLPNDNSPVMVLGGLSCPEEKAREINEKIRDIKEKHGVFKFAEIKWTKVSNSKIDMYKELVDLFFDYSFLSFRAVVAQNKKELDLEAFNLTYDDWYYRIYYLLLMNMVDVNNFFNVYVDIKDTRGYEKVNILKDVLNHALYSFSDEVIGNVQEVKSDQIQLLQLADLLIGAVSYSNRSLGGSLAKKELIDYISDKMSHSLNASTKKSEEKFNIFIWRPQHE